MTYKQAQKLKNGDKVKQKMHGYVMTVNKIEEVVVGTKEYINIYCKTDSGEVMKHNHKEVVLV